MTVAADLSLEQTIGGLIDALSAMLLAAESEFDALDRAIGVGHRELAPREQVRMQHDEPGAVRLEAPRRFEVADNQQSIRARFDAHDPGER